MVMKCKCIYKGPMKELIEWTRSRNESENGRLKFTQPVLIQILRDGFKLPDGQAPNIPAKLIMILTKVDCEVKFGQILYVILIMFY